jgi:hypothetical protein
MPAMTHLHYNISGYIQPKARWMDNVMKDIQAMKIVNWKSVHRLEINGRQLLSRPTLI